MLLAESKVEAYYASKTQLLTSEAQPLFTGSVRSNLYSIDQPTSANVYTITEPSITAINEDERELWHRRTAHLGFKYVEKLPDSVIGVSYQKERRSDRPTSEKAYEPCLAGKMKESFVKKTD